jgi:predicted acyltransferase
MLLVNNPGSWDEIYAPLRHAPWNGWTPTDLVFPSFLWIVGVSLTLSFARRLEEGGGQARLMPHVWRRSAIIFGLGLLLAAFPFGLLGTHTFSLGTLRIPGVLQRIALCYLAASAIFLQTRWRGQLAWTAGLLAAYWAMLAWIPVPGHGAGKLVATGCLPWWVDSHLLAGHTWSGARAPGFDPEGLLSTLPAIASTLLGALAGQVLRGPETGSAKAARLGGLGLGLLLAGLAMNLWMPINKNLWTPSFAVFMAGLSTLLFAGFYWVIDVRRFRTWATPLVMFGMNAIVIYALAGLSAKLLGLLTWTRGDGATGSLKRWIYEMFFRTWASPVDASLAFALVFVAVHGLVAWFLWRRKWFVKV